VAGRRIGLPNGGSGVGQQLAAARLALPEHQSKTNTKKPACKTGGLFLEKTEII